MNSDPIASPAIYRLSIFRFRGIEALDWWPANGVNVILGGGDAGRSKILDAIALLLSLVNPSTLSDPDFHRRDVPAGFSIQAVVSLPPSSGINGQSKLSWPWEWDG